MVYCYRVPMSASEPPSNRFPPSPLLNPNRSPKRISLALPDSQLQSSQAAATSLILYSTVMGLPSSTMNRPEPTYILSSIGAKPSFSVSSFTCTTRFHAFHVSGVLDAGRLDLQKQHLHAFPKPVVCACWSPLITIPSSPVMSTTPV